MEGRKVWSRDGSVEGRRVSRRQNPLPVMVWTAITATGRSPLVFVPSGVKVVTASVTFRKLNCFPGHVSTLIPSHGVFALESSTRLRSVTWLQNDSKLDSGSHSSLDEWPSRSPDLNPLHFSVWSILKSKVCRTPHDSLDNLKLELL